MLYVRHPLMYSSVFLPCPLVSFLPAANFTVQHTKHRQQTDCGWEVNFVLLCSTPGTDQLKCSQVFAPQSLINEWNERSTFDSLQEEECIIIIWSLSHHQHHHPQPPSVITVCVIICSLHNSPVISFGDRHQLLVLAGQAVFLQLPCVVGRLLKPSLVLGGKNKSN